MLLVVIVILYFIMLLYTKTVNDLYTTLQYSLHSHCAYKLCSFKHSFLLLKLLKIHTNLQNLYPLPWKISSYVAGCRDFNPRRSDRPQLATIELHPITKSIISLNCKQLWVCELEVRQLWIDCYTILSFQNAYFVSQKYMAFVPRL